VKQKLNIPMLFFGYLRIDAITFQVKVMAISALLVQITIFCAKNFGSNSTILNNFYLSNYIGLIHARVLFIPGAGGSEPFNANDEGTYLQICVQKRRMEFRYNSKLPYLRY
jgi:hypothetical protein